MARYKVVVSDYIMPNFDVERGLLDDIDAELVPAQCNSAAELIELAQNADAMLNTYFGPLSDEILAACPRLKIVVRYGIGFDTIDVPACTRHGVMAANVTEYCLHEVSDHALGLWLALARKIVLADRGARRGEWDFKPLKPVLNSRGQTAGIIGVGRIGRLTAQKLAPFGLDLLYTDPYVADDVDLGGAVAHRVELDQLCRRADIIFIHAPANDQTHHLLDGERFGQMTRQPIIVNTARAPLIDTAALVTALQQGQVGAAGLDLVDGEELPPEHPLLHMDNVVITPHMAWYSEDSLIELRRQATMEIIRVLQGGRPNSWLNPEVKPR